MPVPEVLHRAADLLTSVGLHRRQLWAGSDCGRSYVPGSSVCAMGAVCVIRGVVTQQDAVLLIASADPALEAIRTTLEVSDYADIAYESDLAGAWLLRESWASWWGSRSMASHLRRAARLAGDRW